MRAGRLAVSAADAAAVIIEGEGENRIEKAVPVEEVKIGNKFVVRPGGSIPVEAGKIQIVALDKTGTITTGIMQVTDVIPLEGTAEGDLIEAAYSLEAKSEHPISKAIVEYAEKNQIKLLETTDFEIKAGNGLSAKLEKSDDAKIYGGNTIYIEENCAILPSQARAQIETLASQGKTPVLFAKDKKILGIIAVADTIKEDSAQAISELKNMGIHTLLLTGDNEITARAIAKQASHESGAVTLETAKPVDESVIKAAVEEAGYEYAGVIA